MSEFAGDGKNTVSMLDINDFKRHGSRPVNGVHVATGRTETGMASKGNRFESTTTRAGTMNHFFDIFDDRVTRM